MGIVPLLDARFDQVHDLVSAGDEKLRDQSPVAALPGSFRAHQAGCGLRQRLVQGGVPGRRAHPRCVTRELAETREQLLARLVAPQPAELGCVLVRDACIRECCCQGRLAELRVAVRRRESPDIDERFDGGFSEAFDELLDRPTAVSDRVDYLSHMRRIAALMGKESTWPRR